MFTFGKRNLILDFILNDIGETKIIKDHLYYTTIKTNNNNNNNNDNKIINIFTTNDTILIQFKNRETVFKRLISSNLQKSVNIDLSVLKNKIKFISCGFNNYHFITDENLVFGIGDNSFNQIGLLNKKEILNSCNNGINGSNWIDSPKLINYFNDNGITIKYISNGRYHSIFIDSNGLVYSCGSNMYGQLGLEYNDIQDYQLKEERKDIKEITQIILLPSNERFVKCSSGDFHNFLITDEGRVYSFGLNSFGQLGLGLNNFQEKEQQFNQSNNNNENNNNNNHHHHHHQNIPNLIESLKNINIVDSKCSSCHSILLSNENQVFTCGKGTNYQLGHDDDESCLAPILIDELLDYKIKFISCSSTSSLFIDNNSRLFYTGGYSTLNLINNNNNNNNHFKSTIPVPIPQIVQQNLNKINNIHTHHSDLNFIW